MAVAMMFSTHLSTHDRPRLAKRDKAAPKGGDRLWIGSDVIPNTPINPEASERVTEDDGHHLEYWALSWQVSRLSIL